LVKHLAPMYVVYLSKTFDLNVCRQFKMINITNIYFLVQHVEGSILTLVYIYLIKIWLVNIYNSVQVEGYGDIDIYCLWWAILRR